MDKTCAKEGLSSCTAQCTNTKKFEASGPYRGIFWIRRSRHLKVPQVGLAECIRLN
jgi:hypothetical protein